MLAGVGLCLLLLAGCDLGIDDSPSRWEQLKDETGKLAKIVQQITDEASANAHLEEMNAVADKIREIQKGIADDQGNNETNISLITNNRQMKLWKLVAVGIPTAQDRIRESDPKAGEIVDKALEGIWFP